MTIENLIKAIPPPIDPPYAFDVAGTSRGFPTPIPVPFDYIELIRLYGAGRFVEFFDIYGPRSPSTRGRIDHVIYIARHDFIHDLQGSLFFDDPPLPIWPRPGGLLAFGQTLWGDYLFWLTRGQVNEWPIVIWDRKNQRVESFECDLTDFLAGVVNGDIQPEAVPGKWTPGTGGVAFRPAFLPWGPPEAEHESEEEEGPGSE